MTNNDNLDSLLDRLATLIEKKGMEFHFMGEPLEAFEVVNPAGGLPALVAVARPIAELAGLNEIMDCLRIETPEDFEHNLLGAKATACRDAQSFSATGLMLLDALYRMPDLALRQDLSTEDRPVIELTQLADMVAADVSRCAQMPNPAEPGVSVLGG
ncbi:MAG: hypothetical protein PVI92_00850 [Chromatiales bacterium]